MNFNSSFSKDLSFGYVECRPVDHLAEETSVESSKHDKTAS